MPIDIPKVNFSLFGLKDHEAVHQAQVVHTNISNSDLFKHQWSPYAVQLDEFGGSITNTRNAMVAAATKDQLKLAELVGCRRKLDHDYYYVGRYAELVVRPDYSILTTLGYTLPQPNTHKGAPPAQAFSNPILKHHGSGTILAVLNAIPGLKGIEAQYTTGDPTVEANWGLSCIFGDRKNVVFSNLIPGQLYSFRFRGIFATGQGPWSVVVTLRAL